MQYADNTVGLDDDQLKLIGWGGRKAKTSLEAPRQGEGWIFLDWKEAVDGGKVAAYRIQRCERPSGPWTDAVGMTDMRSQAMQRNASKLTSADRSVRQQKEETREP